MNLKIIASVQTNFVAEASDQIILLLTISFTGSSRCSNMYQNRERYGDILVCIFHVIDVLCCALFASIKTCKLTMNNILLNCLTDFFFFI